MSDIAIKVENLSKLYKLGAQKSGSFRESFTNLFKSRTPNDESLDTNNEFWALNDVSFEIKKGEAVGIIGRNGAGKSTLLKVLSRITEPTKGRIQINGRVASLLEVGTGFHPELTGRENIYLNGTILGMSRAEVRAKFDEIVDFSGVEKFIDTPVKHYSSGMYVRLAFAVAAHLEPEILIIDEVLAVGDAEFQKKCLGKMEDVTGQGRTVLFVSHNMQAVNTLCNSAIFLQKGKLDLYGDVQSVIRLYNNEVFKTSTHWSGNEGDDNARLLATKVEAVGEDNFFTDTPIKISIKVEVLQAISNMVLGFHLISEFGYELAYVLNDDFSEKPSDITYPGVYLKEFLIPPFTLSKGNFLFRIDLGIHDVKWICQDYGDLTIDVLSRTRKGCRFPVQEVKGYSSLFRPNWSLETNKDIEVKL